jgi:competence ComEA-like helix-hairpin-helix protein
MVYFKSDCIKTFVIGLILTVALFSAVCLVFGRQSIENATQGELERICGIGEVLAERIIDYVEEHPRAEVDDLMAVEGIGEQRLALIKEVYK